MLKVSANRIAPSVQPVLLAGWTSRLWWALAWLAVAWVGIDFLLSTLGRYRHLNEASYTMFWTRKEWLWVHLTGGAAALALGALQFATQSLRVWPRPHRWMGRVYMAFVAVGCVGAAGLIATSPAPRAITGAFLGTSIAWAMTAAAGWAAIRRGRVVAHRRWMVRNYLVTLAPLLFRVLIGLPVVQAVGPSPSTIAVLLHVSWMLPVLSCELVFRWADRAR